jgi:hypothetical protein
MSEALGAAPTEIWAFCDFSRNVCSGPAMSRSRFFLSGRRAPIAPLPTYSSIRLTIAEMRHSSFSN